MRFLEYLQPGPLYASVNDRWPGLHLFGLLRLSFVVSLFQKSIHFLEQQQHVLKKSAWKFVLNEKYHCKYHMEVFRSSSKILILFSIIECESYFTHGQIRASLTSNCHTLRSFSRGCVMATEIFFYQKRC